MTRGFLLYHIKIDDTIPFPLERESEMDKAFYDRLSSSLRQERKERRDREDLIYAFLDGLETRVRDLAGQGRRENLCDWGTGSNDDEFKYREYVGNFSEFNFTLRIMFVDEKNFPMYQVFVPFSAEITEDYIVVRQGDQSESVPYNECLGEHALSEIAALLDKPLRETIEGVPDPYGDD